MTPRILVADDSNTIQKVVELTLRKEDFEIVKAVNGVEAMAKARESKPDLILLDAVMPDKSGYEVCEQLRAEPQFREIPIILLVGAFETFDGDRAQRVGADDHITKPFESRTLIAKVKQHLFARTAKMAAEIQGPRAELREVQVPAAMPQEEVLPSMAGLAAAAPADLGEISLVSDLLLEPETVPSMEEVEKLSQELEPELVSSASLAESAPASAPGGETGGAAVSEEELWQMLDLTGTGRSPLMPPSGAQQAEMKLMPEDTAESFFELYSREPAAAPSPQPPPDLPLEEPMIAAPLEEEPAWGGEMGEGIPLGSSSQAVGEPEMVMPGEGLSAAPQAKAAKGDEMAFLDEGLVGRPFAMEAEEKEMAFLDEGSSAEPLAEAVKGDEMASLPKELVTAGMEEGLPLEAPEEAPREAERVLSEERAGLIPRGEIPSAALPGEIADRIVKEVTDRLISRLERIIWEVVPDLAEVLITKEIEKIKAAAEEQETR